MLSFFWVFTPSIFSTFVSFTISSFSFFYLLGKYLILSIFISHYSFLCFQLLSIHKSSGFKTFPFFSWFSFAAYIFKKPFPLSLNPFSFLFIIYSLFSDFFVFLSCTLSLSTYDSIAIVIKCDSLFLLFNFLPQIFTILSHHPHTFDKWEFSSTNHNTVTCQSVGWLEGWLNWERITKSQPAKKQLAMLKFYAIFKMTHIWTPDVLEGKEKQKRRNLFVWFGVILSGVSLYRCRVKRWSCIHIPDMDNLPCTTRKIIHVRD